MPRGEGGTGQLMDPFGGRPPGVQPTVQVSLSDEPSCGEHLAKIGAVIGRGARYSQRLEGEGLIAEQETTCDRQSIQRRDDGVTTLI